MQLYGIDPTVDRMFSVWQIFRVKSLSGCEVQEVCLEFF